MFLHQGLGSIAQWRNFPALLSARTRLPALVYDRWGFGGSEPLVLPRPLDYLHNEAENTLPEVLAQTGVDCPLFIGHSDGGTIALLYAAAFPDRPAACITEAAHVFVEEKGLAGIRAAEGLWHTTDLKDRLARYHGEKTELMFRGWTETWLDPAFRDWDMTERLPSISCPLLVIQGEDDQYGTARQVETIAAGAGGPVETLMIRSCGHDPHDEQREIALGAMTAFVGKFAAP